MAGTHGSPPAPPGFPAQVALYRQQYRNWAGEIRTDDLWTCAPRAAADVVLVANWAQRSGYTVRARGYRHTWAPLTVANGTPATANTVLVDTTRHLTAMTITGTDPAAVRVQTGASMDSLLGFLESAGCGLTATPAPGDVSVGGVLAIDGHGTAVPAAGEVRLGGHTYGSLSNLVVGLTAVVWDQSTAQFRLATFDRTQPECAVLLAHLGRSFVTEVTLRVGADQNLRCQSMVDIPAAELFAAPGSGATRTLSSFVEQSGRVEAIWFVFTENPWLKVWSVAPTRPLTSRPVTTPYNYPFSDVVPKPVSDLANRLINGEWWLTPTFGQLQYTTASAGLVSTQSTDLWGPSKNLLLYIKPTTLLETANGYAVLTSRASIQRVVHEFTTFVQGLLNDYQAQGQYPITGQMEIRITGLDNPADAGMPGAVAPALSALRPREDHPEWDVAVWFDLLTFPTNPAADAFYREVEQFLFGNYTGDYAAVRVEWSKGWAYTDAAAWSDQTVLTRTVPDTFRQGPAPTWDQARAVLNGQDPYRVFSNAFLDVLLP
jgi:FAD/FMN-containing dehydrogenase